MTGTVSSDTMEEQEHHRCENCLNLALRKCSSCRVVYYCSKECQKKDWRAGGHREICRPLDNKKAISTKIVRPIPSQPPSVKVHTSPVHGKGIFATTKIAPGTPICFFEGEPTKQKIQVSMRKCSKTGLFSIVNATKTFESVLEISKDINHLLYLKDFSFLIGDQTSTSGYSIGQFVNDSSCPKFANLNFKDSIFSLEEYQKCSYGNANVELSPSDSWYISTRNIPEGSEIFTHYGSGFWLQKMMFESSSPLQRLLCYSLQDQGTLPFDLRKFVSYDDETCRCFLRTIVKYDISEEMNPKDIIFELSDKINMIPSS